VSQFLLTKWYLDCLDLGGDGAIIYVAELDWRALRLRYASTLVFTGNEIKSETSIRECSLPECDGDTITVHLPYLGVTGEWQSFSTPVERTIFQDESGGIRWNCLQPASKVTLTLRGKKMEGRGYAEILRMTLPPWQLPLKELHWGHFVSEYDSLVWIDWRGSYNHRVLLHNGMEEADPSIMEHTVQTASARLSLDRSLVLRNGNLGNTVFTSVRSLAKAIPASILHINETKWRSQGGLQQAERSSVGWAIHEVVRWAEE
jgi:hypothetical protein